MSALANMNKREKTLLAITALVVGVLVNFYLVKFFLTNRADLDKQLGMTQARIETLKKRETERELWSQRDAWLNKNMPVLGDPDVANKELREMVLEVAKKHTVTLEAPSPGTPINVPGHISVGVRLEAKSTWEAMFFFLLDLQSPEKFIALENCDIKVNRDDPTQLRATLTVARWYAPK